MDSPSPLDSMGINAPFLLFQIANFIVLFLIIKAKLWKPMIRVMDERSQRIAKGLEDAKAAEASKSSAQVDKEKILKEAWAEGKAIVDKAAKEGGNRREQILEDARGEAAKILAEARKQAESSRDSLLVEAKDHIVALSISAAQKVIGESMDKGKQQKLISEFFTGISSGKIEALATAAIEGEAAEVQTALPLADEDQKTYETELKKKGATGVTFKVDPAILGGVIIRTEDKVIDGSVAGRMQQLSSALK